MLLEVAVRAGATLHGRLHATNPELCSLPSDRLLDELTRGPVESTIHSFGVWQQAYLSALNRTHPPTLGSSIGVLVRRDFKRKWSLATLAHHFRTSPSQIRKSFGRKFGRSVHDYQQLARIVAALDDVRSSKIDALALSVGYHSKKNFYRAFRQLIGRTPIEYRRLNDEEASSVKESARRQLTRENPPRAASSHPPPTQ
jgi:AraC-like DNA-binding protein